MAGSAQEPLVAVECEEEVQRLLQALAKDKPHSVPMLSVAESVLHWGKTAQDAEPAVRTAVYRYRGDADSADGPATAVAMYKVDPYLHVVAIHSTDSSGAALRRVLADTALLPWDEDILFQCVHERWVPALQEAGRDRGDMELYPVHMMYLPKEDALRLESRPLPPGYVMLPLEAKHAAAVLATWHVGNSAPGGLEMYRNILIRTPGLSWGIFPEDDTEGYPAANIIGEFGGHLRTLYTADDHRRKGLGLLLSREACRAMAKSGKDVHANIVYPNPGSEAIFKGLGFRRVCECVFVVHRARRPST